MDHIRVQFSCPWGYQLPLSPSFWYYELVELEN